VDGRALRVYLPDGVNFVECAGKIIIELPDKEPDGSISNNLCVGVDSIDQGKDSLVKDGSLVL
jgi:hypothetical protein